MTMRTTTTRALGAVGLTVALASSALAQAPEAPETPQAPAAPSWKYSVTPIAIWAMSIKGPITVRNRTQEVDASFSDLFDHLQGSFGLGATAVKGRFGAFLNLSYLKIGQDNVGTLPPTDVSLKWFTGELGGTYAAYTGPEVTVSVLAGARYVGLKGEIDAVDETFTFHSKTINWWDPFIGAQVAKPFGNKFAIAVKGDVGGFDISNSTSKLTWSVTPTASYRFPMSGGSWSLIVSGGYRFTSIDFTGDGPDVFQMDVDMKGPTLGLTATF